MQPFRHWDDERTLLESMDRHYPISREMTGVAGYVFDQWVFEEEGTTYAVRFQMSTDFGKKVTQVRFGELRGRRIRLNVGKIRDMRMFMATVMAVTRKAVSEDPAPKVTSRRHGFVLVIPNKIFERLGSRLTRVGARIAKSFSPVMRIHPSYTNFYPQDTNSAIFFWRKSMKFEKVFTQIPQDQLEYASIIPDSGDPEPEPSKDPAQIAGETLTATVAGEPVEVAPEAPVQDLTQAGQPDQSMDILRQTPGTQRHAEAHGTTAKPISQEELNSYYDLAWTKDMMLDAFKAARRERLPDWLTPLSPMEYMALAKDPERYFRPGKAVIAWAFISAGYKAPFSMAEVDDIFLYKLLDIKIPAGVLFEPDGDLEDITSGDAFSIIKNAKEHVQQNPDFMESFNKRPSTSYAVKYFFDKSNYMFPTSGVSKEAPVDDLVEVINREIAGLPEDEIRNNLLIVKTGETTDKGKPIEPYRQPDYSTHRKSGLQNIVRTVENRMDTNEFYQWLSTQPVHVQSLISSPRMAPNIDVMKNGWCREWCFTGGNTAQYESNIVLKDFGINAQAPDLWNMKAPRGGLPENYEPAPWVRGNLETIYHQTQQFYRDKFKKRYENKTIKLYRGIGESQISSYTPGAIESWSLLKSTAKTFADMMSRVGGGTVMVAEVPIQHIWATWESLAPDFSPEEHLKGKKEYIVLGGTFTETPIYVMAGDKLLTLGEWLEMYESKIPRNAKQIKVIDAGSARGKTKGVGHGIEEAEIGLDKLSEEGHRALKKAKEEDSRNEQD